MSSLTARVTQGIAQARRGLSRRLLRAPAGGWALAAGTDGMVAAHLSAGASGRPHLDGLAFLPSGGAHPARRAADVAQALAHPPGDCTLVLSAEDYRTVFLPGLPVEPTERREALQWQLKDQIDFPIAEAVLDCVTARVDNAAFEHGVWMVAAARAARVSELVRPLAQAGVRVHAVDIAETAQRNLAMRCAPPGRTVALLTLDAQRGLLTVSRDDGLLASRQFDPLAEALAQADPERLESLFDRLALELQRTFDNVERQYSAGPIDRLLVLAQPHPEGMIDALGAALGTPVEVLALETLVDSAEPGLVERAARNRVACLAVGAALRNLEDEAG